MSALGRIGIVDLRRRRAVDHRGAAIGRDAEGADITGDRDGARISVHFPADICGEQAVEAGFFLIDDGVEAGLGFLFASSVFFGTGQQPHARTIGGPRVGADIRAIDRGELALRTAIDRNAPDRAVLVLIGPDEADHPAVGRERYRRGADVIGQEFAGIVRAVRHAEPEAGRTVVLAFGHVGQAGSGVGYAATIWGDGDRPHAFQLGDVFRRHRPGLRLRGKRCGGKKGCGGSRSAKDHRNSSLEKNGWALHSDHRAKGKSCASAPCRSSSMGRRSSASSLESIYPVS